MQEKITEVLRELYELDPELSEHESALKEFLEKFLAEKPDPVIDREFAMRLRTQLLAQAESMNDMKLKTPFAFFQSFSFGMTVVALAAVITSGVLYNKAYGPVSFLGFGGKQDTVKVAELSPNAFGALGQVNTARGVGGGGQGGDAESAKLAQGGGGNAEMIAPPYKVHVFKYEGVEVEDLPSQVSVYRKTKDSLRNQAAGFMSRFKLSDFGLKNFTKNQIDMVTVSDDKDSGYAVTVDFINNNISLYQNYNRWSTAEKQCQWNPECIRQRRSGQTQASNEEIVAIAKRFIEDFGISTTGLGEPRLHPTWIQTLELQRSDPSMIPADASVVFPRLVEGIEVRDEGGYASGLMINVNVWDRVVTGASDIWEAGLDKSSYQSETNFARLRTLAEKGSYMAYEPYIDPNAERVTVRLGTPTRGLLRTWQTLPDSGQTSELFVEALFFPVLNQTEVGYWSGNVAIPLAKDILDNQQQPPVTIMPAGE